MLPDSVRIDIQPTKSIFKVWENEQWVVSGTEWVNLFDGTKKMRAKYREVINSSDGDYTIIKRNVLYKQNITVNETYKFLTNTTDVELFPVEHRIQVHNAIGKILQYDVTDLLYTGETINDIKSPQSFGHKMKVEWDEGNYYSRIYKYKWRDVGKLTVKYRINSNDETYNVRLFDPTWFNSSFAYRKKIQINGTGLNVSNNYQLKLDVDYVSGKMNSTFKDLRFTWLNDTTEQEVDYWIEKTVSSTNAIVWVKVPEISNTSNTTIYMYYGNDSAETTSDADKTLGEDIKNFYTFDGDAIDRVGSCNGAVSGATLSTGWRGDSNGAYSFDGNDLITLCSISNMLNTNNWTVTFWTKLSDTSHYNHFLSSWYSSGHYNFWIRWYNVDHKMAIQWENTGGVRGGLSNGSWFDNDWHLLSFTFDDTNDIGYNYLDGIPQGSYSHTGKIRQDGDSYKLQIGKKQDTSDYLKGSLEELRIYHRTLSASELRALYTTAEPTYYFGEEETHDNTPPTITIDSPENITYNYTDIDLNWSTDESLDWIAYSLNGGSNISFPNKWQSDSSITSGLGDVGDKSVPTVFQKDGTWYLIAGEMDGVFNGYNWTGSTWQSDSAIVSGLGDVGMNSNPTIFQKNDNWYLIVGKYSTHFSGYNWTGSTWQSDSAIITGLTIPSLTTVKPTVFQKDGTWYLISGNNNVFYGFKWVGSEWQNDTGIINGLSGGNGNSPDVFYKDDTWYLIVGQYVGNFIGYNWTGTQWQSDNKIVDNLPDIGGNAAPTVFQKSGIWYLIAGESYGVFYGFNGISNTTIIAIEGLNNITIYANDTAGNMNETTQYFTVNTPPTIIANATSPDTVYNNTDWLVNLTITDPSSGDTLTGYVQFYKNDAQVGGIYSTEVTNNTNTLIATLGYGNYTYWDNLTAEFWAGDGTENTSKSNMTTTVQQLIPNNSVSTLYLNGLSQDRYYELGHVAELKANITNSTGDLINETICLDIDSTNYGDDYICSNGTVEYNWTTDATLDEFNDSTTEFISDEFENDTAWFTLSNYSQIKSAYINISGNTHLRFKKWELNETFGCGVPEDSYDAGDIMYNFSGNEKWTLILAHYDSDSYIGYQWNGTCWEENSTLVNGLYNPEKWINPEFNFNFSGDGNTHLFVGLYTGNWSGYTWNGTGWNVNNSIFSGIHDRLWVTAANVDYNLYNENNWTMMTSSYNADAVGYRNYYYNGSTWIEDTTKVCGLPSSDSYLYQNSETFKSIEGLEISRIITTSRTTFQVYQWNGTCWERDTRFESGWTSNTFPKPIILYNFLDYEIINFELGLHIAPQNGVFSYYRLDLNVDYNNDSIADIELPGYLTENYSYQYNLKDSTYHETEAMLVNEFQSSIRYIRMSKDATIETSNLTLTGAEAPIGTNINDSFDISRVGTPRGMNLDSTGRIQIVGDNGIVFEYNTDGTYQTSFNSTIDGAYGITSNGTHYFITETSTNKTHLLWKNGTYIKELFTAPRLLYDIEYGDDGYLYLMEFNEIYHMFTYFQLTKRNVDGTEITYQNVWRLNSDRLPAYLTYGTFESNNYIYTQSNDYGTGISRYYTSNLSETDSCFGSITTYKISGIENDGDYFYVSDYANNVIHKYTYTKSYPSNVTINIGADEDIEYSMSGDFNDSKNIDLNATSIQQYINSNNCESPACNIPIVFSSLTPGYLTYSDIQINYTYNPIELNETKFQDYVDNKNEKNVDIPLNITANYWGNVTLSNLNISYYGDDNVTITAHFDGNVNYYASNNSHTAKIIWSNFDVTLPRLIENIDYMPLTSNSKNVTPFGQTSSIPIMNISSLSTHRADYAIRFDTQPNSCINETISNTSSKNDGGLLTETLTRYLTLDSLDSNGLWLWRDYFSCTAGGTYPDITYNISACCSDCVSCW